MARYMMPEQPSKRIQNAGPRGTEGVKPGQEMPLSQRERGLSITAPKRGRGRPKGSPNKPKGLMPKEVMNDLLPQLREMLPPEKFEYLKGVVKDGKPVSSRAEMEILILLVGRNLYPALLLESSTTNKTVKPVNEFFEDGEDDTPEVIAEPEEKAIYFRKDVTERLKVLQGLLASYEKIERADEDKDSGSDTILKLTVKRGFDSDRILKLVGGQSRSVAGNADGVEGFPDDVGDVSDQVVERPFLLSGGEQGEADRG
jgi:hypothetical protein